MSTPPNKLAQRLKALAAARDATDTDPLRSKNAADADDALVSRSDSAMAANRDLIPGGRYIDALARKANRSPVPSTGDQHGVQDIVRELSEHPTPAEAQAAFQKAGGPSQADINARNKKLTGTSARRNQ